MSTPHPAQHPSPEVRLRRIAAAVAATCVAAFGSGSASAFEFDTGNPDLTIRWDNTVRYNYGVRVENRDNKIGNSADSRTKAPGASTVAMPSPTASTCSPKSTSSI